jgi:hypothetical protein
MAGVQGFAGDVERLREGGGVFGTGNPFSIDSRRRSGLE